MTVSDRMHFSAHVESITDCEEETFDSRELFVRETLRNTVSRIFCEETYPDERRVCMPGEMETSDTVDDTNSIDDDEK